METSYQISLKQSKHHRKVQHMMIMTTNSVDEEVKPYVLHPATSWIAILTLSVLLGATVGYTYHQRQVFADYQGTIEAQSVLIADLEAEKKDLQSTINTLSGEVQILSDTVNTKVAAEAELTEAINSQSMPTEFPLTGSATIEELSEEHPILVFTAQSGTAVVAAAAGTVTEVSDDETYGHLIKIDHGNGYVTVYRNAGDILVKEGDTVAQGNTLYLISNRKDKLGYEMLLDGEYINPMDMLSING
jgi:murein DD-endopeptidase MepM/ murein hydrolase activator NlpD